jgi:hypothetical protein
MTTPKLYAIISLFIISLLPDYCIAGSWGALKIIEVKPLEELWLNPGLYSYHFDTDKNLVSDNWGLGAEYRYSTINTVAIGRFHNSIGENSNYAAWYWQPLVMGSIRLGGLVGIIDGYPNAFDGDWFPMLLPAASYEYKNFGINLTIVPTYKNAVYGSISLQLKLRIN